jgi:hypothetical protein
LKKLREKGSRAPARLTEEWQAKAKAGGPAEIQAEKKNARLYGGAAAGPLTFSKLSAGLTIEVRRCCACEPHGLLNPSFPGKPGVHLSLINEWMLPCPCRQHQNRAGCSQPVPRLVSLGEEL